MSMMATHNSNCAPCAAIAELRRAYQFAEIISRETGDAALLETLRAILIEFNVFQVTVNGNREGEWGREGKP